jgi:hypothetical protein
VTTSSLPPHRPLARPVLLESGLPFSTATLRYRNADELGVLLDGFHCVTRGKLVVVVGLRAETRLPAATGATNARLIFTTDSRPTAPEAISGWFEPDPMRAVVTAMTGLEAGAALFVLLPTDWTGPEPELLVELARQWRATPHSPVDDVFFTPDAESPELSESELPHVVTMAREAHPDRS